MSATAWAAVVVFTIAYALIATEKVPRVTAAVGGAAVMVLIGATDPEHAFYSQRTGIDWNVLALLLGMMLIVAVIQRTGAFEYLAVWAARRARGRPFRLLTILVLVTAVASALLDNVTTVLLVAPVTIAICRRLGLPPVPFLVAEAMSSNIGGTATLVGDPPNIIIAGRAGLSYTDFLIHLAPFVVILMAVFLATCRVLFRHELRVTGAAAKTGEQREATDLRPGDEIRDPRLLVISLVVLGAVTLTFVLHTVLHVEPAVPALIGGLVLLAVSRLPAHEVVADVEWPTLVFFAGLFVMVGALVNTSVISTASAALTDAVGDDQLLAAQGLIWGSALLSALVDNIPYVTTMSPIVADLVSANGSGAEGTSPEVLWWALALGADLGGNATLIGAAANVVVAGIAAHAGHPISFWRFARYGVPVTLVTITLSSLYVWLRYFALT
jgi:Na+/H+ antiporter NhaD/arsenite permease-like protein